MGTNNSFFASVLLSILLLHLCLQHDVVEGAERQALEIIIGGGGGRSSPPAAPPEYQECPPPPPPPCPPPPSPPPPPPSPPPPSPPPPSPPPPSPPPPSPPPPSPPPPPKPRPPPPKPILNDRLIAARKVILRFKQLIIHDPKGITDSWNPAKSPCTYKGFTCASVPVYNQKTVAGVDFNGYKLAGDEKRKLPLGGFMDKLDDLVFFHANSNNFTGTVPTGLTKLKYFYEFDLSNNKLSQDFPYEILNAKNLTFLDLRFNYFRGTVPPQVFILDVDVLFLNNNQFTQQIPDALGQSPAHYLTFANNQFTGPIPRTIGNLSKTLYEVLFLNNQLSGCLPMEIGYLNQATLFDVSSNYLTGPIPQSFACLAKMEILNLANNQFYGTVPELVCKLPNLGNLSLANNYFTQVGPECRKLIKKGFLDVKDNCIRDLPNQKSKSDCAWFFSKSRNCPNERSLLYIPCQKGYYSIPDSNKQLPEHQGQAPAPLTYGTLKPHGL